jgi:hypothetical protein
MELKTGCVKRDLACRKAMKKVSQIALDLQASNDAFSADIAKRLLDAVTMIEE